MKRVFYILIFLFFSLVVGAANAALAPEEVFNRLAPGDVHVDIKGLESYDYTDEDVISAVEHTWGSLPLDINFVYDDNISNGGISLVFSRGLPACFGTRQFKFFKSEYLGPYEVLSPYIVHVIKADLDCLEMYTEGTNRDNAFINMVVHEFGHGIKLEHIRGNILPKFLPVMNPSLSTAEEYFTYADKRAALEKYGPRPGTRTFKFAQEQIGLDAILINKRDPKLSIGFKIVSTEMVVPYVKRGPYKVIVK